MYKIVGSLFLILISSAWAWPDGGPVEACNTMRPVHDPEDALSNIDAPYTVKVSETEYHKGQTLTVTVNSTGNKLYKGIFLQVRPDPDIEGNGIGTWFIPSDIPADYHYQTCGNPRGAITHTQNTTKTLPLSFDWTAPVDTDHGSIKFYVTVAEQFNRFYVKLSSDTVTGSSMKSIADMTLCLLTIVTSYAFMS